MNGDGAQSRKGELRYSVAIKLQMKAKQSFHFNYIFPADSYEEVRKWGIQPDKQFGGKRFCLLMSWKWRGNTVCNCIGATKQNSGDKWKDMHFLVSVFRTECFLSHTEGGWRGGGTRSRKDYWFLHSAKPAGKWLKGQLLTASSNTSSS